MTITTKFNIGDTVKIKEYRRITDSGVIDATIRRIIVSKDGLGNTNIRYTIAFPEGQNECLIDLWETDLAAEQEEVFAE